MEGQSEDDCVLFSSHSRNTGAVCSSFISNTFAAPGPGTVATPFLPRVH